MQQQPRSAGMARRMLGRMSDHELGELVQAGRAVQDRLAAEGRLAILDGDVAAIDAARQARDTLVARHHPLVVHLARRWTAAGVELDDLVVAGLIGLTRAIELWDPERGVPLGAWARVRIRQAISRAADEARGTTEDRRARLRAVRETEAALAAALGRAPTMAEVAAALGWPVERVQAATARPVVVPLDAVGGGAACDDRLVAPDDPASSVEHGIEGTAVHRMLAVLPPAERQVVVLLHGLDGGEPVTALEAARRLGISPGTALEAARRARARLLHPRYRGRWQVA